VVTFAQTFAGIFVVLLWLLVFARIMLSWVDPRGGSRASQVVISLTEPLLAPVRRVVPQAGMFDFSSLLVLVVLGVLWRALLG
jgi:YggT family protein